jgi:hypothetical protein
VGVITRVGIHKGVTKGEYAKPIHRVEADIETASGQVCVGQSLLDRDGNIKISRSVLDFAWGLLQFTRSDDPLMIEAAQGEAWKDDKGNPMSPSTYVNFSRVDAESRAHPLYKPRRDPKAPKVAMNDQWTALEPQIRSHPLFAERPVREHDDDDEGGAPATHLQAFCQECAAKGWPTPQQAPDEWLTMYAAAFAHAKLASLADYTDEEHGQVREKLAEQTDMPKLLKPVAERMGLTKAQPSLEQPAKTPDPFASE